MLKDNKEAKGIQDTIGSALSAIPLSPNHWTLISFLFALVSAYFIIQQNLLYAAVLFGISALVDAVDGAVARATNRATKFGAFFDGLIDRFSEAAVLLALFFFNFKEPYAYFAVALFLFFGTCMTAFVRAYADHRKVIAEEDLKKMGGLFERAERSVFLFIILLLGSVNSEWLVLGLLVGAVLSILTVLQRFFFVVKNKVD